MSRIKLTAFFAVLFLAGMGMVLSGCASTGATDAAAAADIPSAPAKKPFQPPSYDAAEFSSDEHGFSVHYPSDFEEQAGQGLFSAASPNMVPRVDVIVTPAPGDPSLDGVGSQLEALLAQVGGGEAKVTASKETTLQDGVTAAKEFIVDWTFQGFPIQSVIVATMQEAQMINVQVTAMQGGDVEEMREIAYTLYFKD